MFFEPCARCSIHPLPCQRVLSTKMGPAGSLWTSLLPVPPLLPNIDPNGANRPPALVKAGVFDGTGYVDDVKEKTQIRRGL